MKSIEQDPIEELIKTKAIEQLVARFARACDWLSLDELHGCFIPGAIVRFGPHAMTAAEFIDFWNEMGTPFKARHHLVGVPMILFTAPDAAFVEVAAIVAGTRAENGVRLRDFMECDRYMFDVKLHDGGWRISDARILVPWSQGGPTPTAMEAGIPLSHGVTTDHPWFVPVG